VQWVVPGQVAGHQQCAPVRCPGQLGGPQAVPDVQVPGLAAGGVEQDDVDHGRLGQGGPRLAQAGDPTVDRRDGCRAVGPGPVGIRGQDGALARCQVDADQVDPDPPAREPDLPLGDHKGPVGAEHRGGLVERLTGIWRDVPHVGQLGRVGAHLGQGAGEKVGLLRPQLVVPVPERQRLVQHGGDLAGGPLLAPRLVVPAAPATRRHLGREDHHRGVPGGSDPGDPSRVGGHRPRLAPSRREAPDTGGVVVLAPGSWAVRDEEQ
jgi:hypothetical protein